MNSAFVRRCLRQLSNEEITEMLSAFPWLKEEIRKLAKKPKNFPVTPETVRRWASMPPSSDKLLRHLPKLTADHVAESGRADIVWPSAIVAFKEIALVAAPDETVFDHALEEARTRQSTLVTQPEDAPLPDGGESLATEGETAPEGAPESLHPVAEQLKALSFTLISETSEVIRAISEGRRAAVDEQSIAERWNAALEAAWVTLGEVTPEDSSFTRLSQAAVDRDEALDREATEKRHTELEARRGEFRGAIEGLKALAGTNAAFQEAYDQALAGLTQVEAELRAEGVERESSIEKVESKDQYQEFEQLATRDIVDDSADLVEAEPSATESELLADPDPEDQRSSAPEPGADFEASLDPLVVGKAEDESRATAFEKGSAVVGDDDSDTEQMVSDGELGDTDSPPEADESEMTAEEDAAEDAASGNGVDEAEGPDLAEWLKSGRFGAAWFVAQVSGAPSETVDVLRLASDAFHSGYGGIDPSSVLVNASQLFAAGVIHDADVQLMALAACLRAGLAAGWLSRNEVDHWSKFAVSKPSYDALVKAVVEASSRGYQHLRDSTRLDGHTPREIVEKAAQLKVRLDSTHPSFTRADHTLHYLLRSDEPLGRTLDLMLELDSGGASRSDLSDALESMSDSARLIKEADIRVSSPQQLRKPIIGNALGSLERCVQDVRDLLSEAITTAAQHSVEGKGSAFGIVTEDLLAAAAEVSNEEATTPGEQVMSRLVSWIQDPAWIRPEITDVHALRADLVSVTSAQRSLTGIPEADGVELDTVLEELRHPPSTKEMFAAYDALGDLQSAGDVAILDDRLTASLVQSRRLWATRLAAKADMVREEIGRTFIADYSGGAPSEFEARLVGPSEYEGDRFDLQVRTLEGISADLERKREATSAALRDRVKTEITDDRVADRVRQLLKDEDFIGANELLALARDGQRVLGKDNGVEGIGTEVFDEFKTALASLTQGDDLRAASQALGTDRDGSNLADPKDAALLEQWSHLVGARMGSGALKAVLRACGLDVVGDIRSVRTAGRHYSLYKLKGTPLDGSLVPALGSQAALYNVAVTSDVIQIEQTLSAASDHATGPLIVLVDRVLSFETRRQILKGCRDGRYNAIVIDVAVAAFVAKSYSKSFRAMQQLTLPFASFNHYTSVAGKVPDEVFVGRYDELRKLRDPAGSQFVYGGRQLGKSALLRKLKDDFEGADGHIAVYLDLNSHGIGSWSDPADLWGVLYNNLSKYPDFGVKQNPNVRNSEPVIKLIQTWLEGAPDRRMLLLLDEADAFLEKESSTQPNGFRNIGPLKRLKEDTDGRFKPIFAGLHKVQRLQNVANTPLAHGGDDVLVGPLAAGPARQLVTRPLEALGYKFVNPNHVWRLLAFTNMQPGLIQIVCIDLIEQLRAKRLSRNEPLIDITEEDIDTITRSRTTRKKIADKLRLTIRLEERFRVIALTAAIMSMDDAFLEQYQPQEIRDFCEVYWTEGFVDLTSSEFAVYLDELVGLGVLSRSDEGTFSMRSPNIVTMLGTREELEAELTENSDQFELPQEFNPRAARRPVTIKGRAGHSPLAEHDLSVVIPMRRKYDTPRDFVIVGSRELRLDLVSEVLHQVAVERDVEMTILEASETTGADAAAFAFSGAGASRPRLLLVDATRADLALAESVAVGLKKLRNRAAGHLVVVFPADAVSVAVDFADHQTSVSKTLIPLEKWSGDGVRAWHDIPFATPPERKRLVDLTGGWPRLIEKAVMAASGGKSLEDSFRIVETFPASAAQAIEFLEACGVNETSRRMLGQWAELASAEFELVDVVADILDQDPDELRSLAVELSTLGVVNEHANKYQIDPVVVRALQAVGEQ
ncbi:hypothetical protein OVA21_13860 [Dietzia sp. SL131]|uniref:hypothetical protein n=1 Tax=Dietzia sp. SL131 TaxID=2995149 RepID=UPI00227D07F0|nr:hypothetical protein [Dietzia sp. SL131]MCY1658271.1 hypothetical protein [Dietzia sp. SL131]